MLITCLRSNIKHFPFTMSRQYCYVPRYMEPNSVWRFSMKRMCSKTHIYDKENFSYTNANQRGSASLPWCVLFLLWCRTRRRSLFPSCQRIVIQGNIFKLRWLCSSVDVYKARREHLFSPLYDVRGSWAGRVGQWWMRVVDLCVWPAAFAEELGAGSGGALCPRVTLALPLGPCGLLPAIHTTEVTRYL